MEGSLGRYISFTDIAKAEENLLSGLPFATPCPSSLPGANNGYVVNTVDSWLIAANVELFDAVGCLLEDVGVGFQTITKGMERWPGSDERNHSPCCYAYNTEMPFLRLLAPIPE